MPYKLKKIIIKPELGCTANCPTCALRLKFFSGKKKITPLSILEWQRIIEQAKSLGCENLNISGGEPLLYINIIDLIKIGVTNGMKINLNTNGSLVTEQEALRLYSAGLNSVNISVYSHKAEIHDKMRNELGLFKKAINAIKYFKNAGVTTNLQTILTNYNIENLDDFLEFAYELKIHRLKFSYLEGDIDNCWLPTIDKICNFRNVIIPKMINIINLQPQNKSTKEALVKVANIFSSIPEKIHAFSKGEYAKICKNYCSIPYELALILSDGSVLPCNGAEYSFGPVIGNVKEKNLSEIFLSDNWDAYRIKRHNWCSRCPMGLHFSLPIMHVA